MGHQNFFKSLFLNQTTPRFQGAMQAEPDKTWHLARGPDCWQGIVGCARARSPSSPRTTSPAGLARRRVSSCLGAAAAAAALLPVGMDGIGTAWHAAPLVLARPVRARERERP